MRTNQVLDHRPCQALYTYCLVNLFARFPGQRLGLCVKLVDDGVARRQQQEERLLVLGVGTRNSIGQHYDRPLAVVAAWQLREKEGGKTLESQ